jgi:ferrous iron transport protein A
MFANPRQAGELMPALSELRPGDRARVIALGCEAALTQRLYEFGLMEGEEVELLTLAPLGDPLEIRLGNTRLSLRRSEAAGITVQLV